MNRTELKIVSGAQTGVDQDGLLTAIELGLEWGGWVPKGWRTENGTVAPVVCENRRPIGAENMVK